MSRATANLLLLLAAAIWGAAFVPQSTAMRAMSPAWFLVLRFGISLIVTMPLLIRELRRSSAPMPPRHLALMVLIGVVFVVGTILQQTSLLSTSVANAGFLTSLYILFTPFVAMALTHERPGPAVWPAAAMGLGGAWLLTGGVSGSFVLGDLLVTLSAIAWALQIVLIGIVMRASQRTMTLVAIQSALVVVPCGLWAIVHDPISFEAIVAAAPELAYTGIVSGFVGYTLQAVAQRHTEASDAAIIFSTEAPFAALLGVILLGEHLGTAQWLGAGVIFAAVLLVQSWPARRPIVAGAEGA